MAIWIGGIGGNCDSRSPALSFHQGVRSDILSVKRHKACQSKDVSEESLEFTASRWTLPYLWKTLCISIATRVKYFAHRGCCILGH